MKRAEQLEKTRQAIIKTATKLFLQKGFGETSTRDIAKQIGITQPALYHHFSDKEVLYLDVMNKLSGKIRQEINKVIRKHDLASEEQLLEIVKILKKHHPLSIYDQYRQTMLLLSKSSQQKLNIIFTMDYLEPISDYFKQPSVKLRPDLLPKEAAELFLASLSPLFGTYQLIGGHSISDDERDQLILDCIINGLAKRGK
ncbi:MAG: TetR/AcrR family transcriptional regulator [Limosilactobacillus oris]|jgi:AcrR family transcriptional regulator|uniref:TetR/AcrR family transcriptional regulator n=1 Tax=Candidatus Limosilactobacillus merdipullorum TaxID=2838653 RepID=A0A9D1QP47_9LACO|nr:TetR/AcrR family transcriptional regulator [Limosilactobacillus oris]HIW69994.1 TetR/AcrR family transcriptional regulator [Candidatus Limosilactobacillus merdipullorum]AMS07911.1 TetR family transcriptional regulator [Limosilactobacillus oris]MBF0600550.1 TetR/AcrR family transcriptional regulator [Limosilactobacillus oris]MCH3911037.1 TetR/AcrR family transcriptional regulator [Limosilactobacillus oris]MCH3938288.1 TetR/AcrR family transcriptional regulator [Limosilactobacillus oris]